MLHTWGHPTVRRPDGVVDSAPVGVMYGDDVGVAAQVGRFDADGVGLVFHREVELFAVVDPVVGEFRTDALPSPKLRGPGLVDRASVLEG